MLFFPLLFCPHYPIHLLDKMDYHHSYCAGDSLAPCLNDYCVTRYVSVQVKVIRNMMTLQNTTIFLTFFIFPPHFLRQIISVKWQVALH